MFKKYFSRKKAKISRMTQPTLDHWASLKTDFHNRLDNLSRNRTKSASVFAENNFQVLLNAWGMRYSDIPHVLKSLYIRLYLFIFLLIFSVFPAVQGYYIPATCFLVVGVTGILTTAWRISILKSERFIPFVKWLFRQS